MRNGLLMLVLVMGISALLYTWLAGSSPDRLVGRRARQPRVEQGRDPHHQDEHQQPVAHELRIQGMPPDRGGSSMKPSPLASIASAFFEPAETDGLARPSPTWIR